MADLQTGAVQHASAGVGGVAGNGDSPVQQGERVALSHDGRWNACATGARNLGVQNGQIVRRKLDSDMFIEFTSLNRGWWWFD